MFTLIMGRLALCVLAEAARQGLPVLVKLVVRRCLKKTKKEKMSTTA